MGQNAGKVGERIRGSFGHKNEHRLVGENTLADARLLFSGSNKIPPQVQRQGKSLLPGQVNLRGLYGWLCGGYAVVTGVVQFELYEIFGLYRGYYWL